LTAIDLIRGSVHTGGYG